MAISSPRARRARRAVLVAPALLACLAGGLTACSEPVAGPGPAERVEDVVDALQADNTGAYTMTVELGDLTITEQGYYRVAPDANGTVRTVEVDGATGEHTGEVRYLRQLNDVWAELAETRATSPRASCWVHGNVRAAVRDAGDAVGLPSDDELDAGSAGDGLQRLADTLADLPLVSPPVEVVLSLRHGREEDGVLLADANLRSVASALGFRIARDLDLPDGRVDVPVVLEAAEGRILSWTADLADVVEAAGADDPDDVLGTSTPGEVRVEFTEPRTRRDFSAPDDALVAEIDDGEEALAEKIATCGQPASVVTEEPDGSPTGEPDDQPDEQPTDQPGDTTSDAPEGEATDQG